MSLPESLHPLPTAEDVTIARDSSRVLAASLKTRATTRRIDVYDDQGVAHAIHVPVSALHSLVKVLTEVAAGNTVSVVPNQAELTTQQAADLLNVSRPYLVGLLERGEMPFHKVGAHRRVRYRDLLTYQTQIDAERRKALAELAEQAQALKMGYE